MINFATSTQVFTQSSDKIYKSDVKNTQDESKLGKVQVWFNPLFVEGGKEFKDSIINQSINIKDSPNSTLITHSQASNARARIDELIKQVFDSALEQAKGDDKLYNDLMMMNPSNDTKTYINFEELMNKADKLLKEKNTDHFSENSNELYLDINLYFADYYSYAIGFDGLFSYLKEKLPNLDIPYDEINENTSIIKDYVSSNYNSITLDNGIVVKADDNMLKIYRADDKFSEINVENTKFNTLFSIFDNREKEENLKERINLNLEEKAKNTKLNTKQSPLSELLNSKDL
ncbi:hypothetical protein [uncultured Campylobacter sp.]|uniref:hypothetical protein n=1 Tax=uncultured Campylobacter sp. TaxID=218934 RepID=UPI00262754DC|nr:hypothetical protein [uncultured Campylobacter sp.]